LYIPSDDITYNSYSEQSIPGQLSTLKSIPFNRSDVDSTQIPKYKRNGFNNVTPFLDLGPVYGITADESKNLRDIGNRGKLKTNGNTIDPYPPKNATTGKYLSMAALKRSSNIFTMAVMTIWLREHNRLCDKFYDIHGDAWTDDQYFEEAVSNHHYI